MTDGPNAILKTKEHTIKDDDEYGSEHVLHTFYIIWEIYVCLAKLKNWMWIYFHNIYEKLFLGIANAKLYII